jgi:hypothetical protein
MQDAQIHKLSAQLEALKLQNAQRQQRASSRGGARLPPLEGRTPDVEHDSVSGLQPIGSDESPEKRVQDPEGGEHEDSPAAMEPKNPTPPVEEVKEPEESPVKVV